MELEKLIQAAQGLVRADLLLTRCQLVNVFTGEIQNTDVAVAGGWVVGVGPGYAAERVLDLNGGYLCPGLINAHVHVESSMVVPTEFARAVVPHGTTTAVTDPHEIANVCGLAGIRYMLDAGSQAPMSILAMAPSCVPATHMSTAGASLNAVDLQALRDDPRVLGLAEMMNFPGVLMGQSDVLDKLRAFAGRPMDGHAPGLHGRSLNAYVAAGIGSDHECITADEALEKLRLGMRVLIREGSTARNLGALLPAARLNPSASRRCSFCTDDRHPAELLDEGDIDALVRGAIAAGLDPITAIQMATLNPAEWFDLHDRGAVAPGRRADLVAFSDLYDFRPDLVMVAGRIVAQAGQMTVDSKMIQVDDAVVRSSVRVCSDSLDLRIPAVGRAIRVIGAAGDQLLTEHRIVEATVQDGLAVADAARDLAKMAVIERHHGTGRVGLGFVSGMGFQRGALATTVCHDHHNLLVIGVDDRSMMTAIRAVVEMGGGEVVARRDQVVQALPLPVAGLMSDRPVEQVRRDQEAMLLAAASLGCRLHDPFMTASFLALEVIPALKLTDQGLVDVNQFKLVDLWVD